MSFLLIARLHAISPIYHCDTYVGNHVFLGRKARWPGDFQLVLVNPSVKPWSQLKKQTWFLPRVEPNKNLEDIVFWIFIAVECLEHSDNSCFQIVLLEQISSWIKNTIRFRWQCYDWVKLVLPTSGRCKSKIKVKRNLVPSFSQVEILWS